MSLFFQPKTNQAKQAIITSHTARVVVGNEHSWAQKKHFGVFSNKGSHEEEKGEEKGEGGGDSISFGGLAKEKRGK